MFSNHMWAQKLMNRNTIINPNWPAFGEADSNGVTEDVSLISYVLHYILGPFHQFSNLVARRRPIDVPLQHFFNLFTQYSLSIIKKTHWIIYIIIHNLYHGWWIYDKKWTIENHCLDLVYVFFINNKKLKYNKLQPIVWIWSSPASDYVVFRVCLYTLFFTLKLTFWSSSSLTISMLWQFLR